MTRGDYMATFGENLRNLRKSRKYSQDRFAREIGSNQVTLSAWEVGTRVPSIGTIRHIAEVFHVPISSLIPIADSGTDADYVSEVADMLRNDPKIRLLFDRARYLSSQDIDALLQIIDAITRERATND